LKPRATFGAPSQRVPGEARQLDRKSAGAQLARRARAMRKAAKRRKILEKTRVPPDAANISNRKGKSKK